MLHKITNGFAVHCGTAVGVTPTRPGIVRGKLCASSRPTHLCANAIHLLQPSTTAVNVASGTERSSIFVGNVTPKRFQNRIARGLPGLNLLQIRDLFLKGNGLCSEYLLLLQEEKLLGFKRGLRAFRMNLIPKRVL
jgi:hypothetical protein